jgi:carboxylesterase type B
MCYFTSECDVYFQAPQAPESWTGVRDAFEEGNICAQKDLFLGTYKGDDDCLYLNVYTPKVRGSTDATSDLRYKIVLPFRIRYIVC